MTLTARSDPDDARLLDVVRGWLPGRRWYPAKGVAAAELSVVAGIDLADDVRILLVRVNAGSIDVVLQVPLVLGSADGDVIGTLDGRPVCDGAPHPAFLRAWLAAADGPGIAADPSTARMISGEQSNTSVILGGGILKVLRTVAPGENPDVDVPRHLVSVGWPNVPAPLAWLQATWPGAHEPGYLGVLSAFVDSAQDGFELACDYARRGEPFVGPATDLGTVTLGMHAALVSAYGVMPSGTEEVARSVENRFAWALSAVPRLARFADGVAEVVADVRALPSAPPRQRVHGDLHLGQVLRSHETWFITDFEGEPLAPLDQRTKPDLAVRDVAGLLRSIDYAAAVGGLTGGAAQEWATQARDGLLAGYGLDEHATLVRALELDKTLYEAVYESRNRPTWLPIPIAGLERLTSDQPRAAR